MLVALLYLYNAAGGSFDLLEYHSLPLTGSVQTLIFLAFFAAFAVKVPMVPVHTWLPDAHVEAPTGGSVILAAITLKMGGYGFLRLAMPIAPDAAHDLAWIVVALSLVAVVYIALVALVQRDMKKLIAYSSISHMGFVTLGFFVFNAQAMEGAVVQMISHGFVPGGTFSLRWRPLRPPPFERNCHLRRGDQVDAGLRIFHGVLCDGKRGFARDIRFRWRVFS